MIEFFFCRLWGENGQQALETSRVCLINANVVGTEVLKNLVLPGIRAFTIIDDQTVSEDDADSNFFLSTEGSIGQSRAKVAATFLLEMNEDVKNGDYLHENFETLLDKDVNYFTNFSLIIACGIRDERSLNRLSQEMWSLNIPLLVVKSIGFLGYIRLQIQEHCVLEPHPDNTLEDLRLTELFPELSAYFDSFPSFEELTRQELSRIPSLVIIYKNLLKWRKEYQKNSNEIPKNYREKSSLIAMIKDEMFTLQESKAYQSFTDESGGARMELENFEEAYKLVNKIFYDSPKISKDLQQLLNESKLLDMTMLKQKSSNFNFWIMMKALNEFIARHDCLPLKGSIPDMNSGSEQYIRLQKLYKTKAKEDAQCLSKIIQDTFKCSTIPDSDIHLFCKNVRYLRIIRTSPIYQEMQSKTMRNLVTFRLQNDEEESDSDELRFYILMRLIDRFYSKHRRFPGQNSDEVDISELKVFINLYIYIIS